MPQPWKSKYLNLSYHPRSNNLLFIPTLVSAKNSGEWQKQDLKYLNKALKRLNRRYFLLGL